MSKKSQLKKLIHNYTTNTTRIITSFSGQFVQEDNPYSKIKQIL